MAQVVINRQVFARGFSDHWAPDTEACRSIGRNSRSCDASCPVTSPGCRTAIANVWEDSLRRLRRCFGTASAYWNRNRRF